MTTRNLKLFGTTVLLAGALVACATSSSSKKTDAAPATASACKCADNMPGCGCPHCSTDEGDKNAPACPCGKKK